MGFSNHFPHTEFALVFYVIEFILIFALWNSNNKGIALILGVVYIIGYIYNIEIYKANN